jgi:hypothetical protein
MREKARGKKREAEGNGGRKGGGSEQVNENEHVARVCLARIFCHAMTNYLMACGTRSQGNQCTLSTDLCPSASIYTPSCNNNGLRYLVPVPMLQLPLGQAAIY